MNGPVDFYIQGKDKTIYFTPAGVTFALTYGTRPKDEKNKKDEWLEPRAPRRSKTNDSGPTPTAKDVLAGNYSGDGEMKRWTVKTDFVGGRKNAKPEGLDKTGAVISYFKGKPDDWHAGLTAFAKIIYRDLWPGIDLVCKGDFDKLKYEFIIHPGADPRDIAMDLRGVEKALIDGAGRLEIATPAGSFTDEAPLAYQDIGGKRIEVPVAFKLAERKDERDEKAGTKSYFYGFEAGAYDRSRILVLDPAVLIYCGYIGGSLYNIGYGIAVDAWGNAYVTGATESTEASFPVTVGPDLTYNGGRDVFIAKVKADGSGLVYCGYIGGLGADTGYSIAVDGWGNAYVTGVTESTEASFPVTVGPDLIYSGNGDAFVAKVKADGSGLDYCGYIGGLGADAGYGIAVDSSGNAYVAGATESTEGSFPVAVGPDLTFNGSTDAFVVKVNADGWGLAYCGYIGGSSNDGARGIAVDGLGNAYVTGTTASTLESFPVTVGPNLMYSGWGDAFVAKVKADGSGLAYCGYIGGSSNDYGYGIAVDESGNAYIAGETWSRDLPRIVGPSFYCTDDENAFAAKVKADGSGFTYCGYIPSSYVSRYANGIAVDGSGNAYVTGSAGSFLPVIGGPDLTYNGGGDCFVAKIHTNEFFLTIISRTGGTTNPAPGTYKYGENSVVTVQAIPSDGYRFDRWSFVGPAGVLSDAPVALQSAPIQSAAVRDAAPEQRKENEPTISITMDFDKTVTAIFKKTWTLTMNAGPGGTTNPVPGTHVYDDGTPVRIQATASAGYRFGSWSCDITGTANPVTITMNGNKTVTANFIRLYALTITAGAGGTTNPSPGTYAYDEGTSVSVQAVPAAAFELDNWTGDVSGSNNPVTIVMNGNKSIQANFARVVKPPLGLTGEKLANRAVSMVEYVARLRWQPNTANTGTVSYRVYKIENGRATAIAEVGAGKFEYIVRRLQRTLAYRFAVTAVNSQGWESDMVEVAIQ